MEEKPKNADEAARANKLRLAACPGPSHDFAPDPTDEGCFPRQVCSRCGGKASHFWVEGYREGLKDGLESWFSSSL